MKRYGMKELLQDAREGSYAYAAVNVSNMETVSAVMKASAELDIPVILQIAPIQQETQGFTYQEIMLLIGEISNRFSKGGYAVHLDHSTSHHHCKAALTDGFDSVMFDGARLSYEENIRETALARNYCKDVCLEGELGIVGGNECTEDDTEAIYTEPKKALEFVEKTGVDCLAIAIGNAHGRYKGKPHLAFDVLKEIKRYTNVPLVLHGASGIPLTDIFQAISLGINKINYFTEVDEAFMSGFMEEAEKGQYMMMAARSGQKKMEQTVKKLIYACRNCKKISG